jgi:hypothetical protein
MADLTSQDAVQIATFVGWMRGAAISDGLRSWARRDTARLSKDAPTPEDPVLTGAELLWLADRLARCATWPRTTRGGKQWCDERLTALLTAAARPMREAAA